MPRSRICNLVIASRFRGEASSTRLGRVDKLNPDADGGKQHESGKALGQFVVAGGDLGSHLDRTDRGALAGLER